MKLAEYLFKKVKITDLNGNVFKGYADLYEDKEDSGYGEPSIGIILDKDGSGIEFVESEIKKIELLN